jgi:hypothetical protein
MSQTHDQSSPPGSDVRTMATEPTRTADGDMEHKAVCHSAKHCEHEAPQQLRGMFRTTGDDPRENI